LTADRTVPTILSWPGSSGPPIQAPAAAGGSDKPGHDESFVSADGISRPIMPDRANHEDVAPRTLHPSRMTFTLDPDPSGLASGPHAFSVPGWQRFGGTDHSKQIPTSVCQVGPTRSPRGG